MTRNTRIKADSLGQVEVSADVYWGAQTQRSLINFPFGPTERMPIEIVHALACIRLLASGPRAGIGEMLLPENEPGSSIMPGKVNSTQCEMLTMVAAQVMGNHAAVALGGMQGQLELNVFKPLIGVNVLRSIDLLAPAIISFTQRALVGLLPDRARLAQLVKRSLMLVTALVREIGYENAAKIAAYAQANNLTLRQAALDTGLVDEATFDRVVRAEDMVGQS